MARKNSLLRFLHELDKEELIAEIEKLCGKFEAVKKYFDIELTGDAGKYVAASKKKISQQFRYSNGDWRRNPKASRLNTIIRDFGQISIYRQDVIELLLYRLEETQAYHHSCGSLSEALTRSTALALETARELIAAEGLEEQYRERMANLDWL